MNSLNTRAMLTSLSIRRWQATRTDQKITTEVAEKHSVNARRAGHYRKHAIDVDAPSFKAVASAASDLRHKHYDLTLPWGQDGARILTATMFETYSNETRKLRAAFERAAAAFVADYPRLCASARAELNGLWDAKDYPSNIAAKFGVEITIMPLPDADDFRVALTDDVTDEIKANITAELAKTTEAAMKEPYQRLYDHVSRMVERLRDPEGVVRDTLVTGLADLCAILPGLNLTNDPTLEDLRKRAETMVTGLDAQQIRDSDTVRIATANKAAEIQSLMSGLMGGAQ